MNDKLLVQKRINFNKEYIDFLNFLHPDFEIVGSHPLLNVIESLDQYDNPNPRGIIYNGVYESDTIEKLNRITQNWIVINAHNYDIDLTTNEGLIKNLIPLHYIQLKNSKDNLLYVYKEMNYGNLLDKIKLSLLDNSPLTYEDETDNSVYGLYQSILGTPDILNWQFFNTVTKENANLITSSILTFLTKVQSQSIKNVSPGYANLIIQSNKRYGKHIKQAISKYVKSKSNKEISLYKLLTFLNRAK